MRSDGGICDRFYGGERLFPPVPGRLSIVFGRQTSSMSSPPPVTGISELVLEVDDLEAARHFYGEVLGFEETLYGEGREGRYWYLIGETARLGLWTPQVGLAGGRGGAHVHFAFHLPDTEIEALAERLEGGTASQVEGPIQLGPGRAIYVTDPDRNVVEFWSQDMAAYYRGAREDGSPGSLSEES